MAIVPVPATVRFTDFDIALDAPSDEMKSPFNGKRQVAKLPYDVWSFRGDLVPLDPMDAASVKSFLMKLAGRVNTFKLYIAGSKFATSNYAGTDGLAYTAGQTGTFITGSGFTPNTLVLREGDYFNIGNELKVATADYITDPNGRGGIAFMPPLRKPTQTADPTGIFVKDPFLYLHATRDDVAKWSVKPPVRHAFKLEAEEEI